MQKSLTEMERRAFEAEAVLKTKEHGEKKKCNFFFQRLRRKNRARLPIRDPAGLYELNMAINYVLNKDSSDFVKAREIVCLTILYYTGLRISNLRLLQVRHIKQLLEEYKFDIPLIKKKESIVHTFYIPSVAYKEFDLYKNYYQTLINNKQDDSFIITNEDSTHILSRVHFTRSINEILAFVSKKTNRNIKSHSFRINLTTALIETVGLEEASKIIGHNDIRTTEMYNRRVININDMTNALSKAHLLLLKTGKRKMRIRKAKDQKKDKK